jgi:hypothetical protein
MMASIEVAVMKRMIVLFAALVIGVLMLPAGVLADTTVLNPGTYHDETYVLTDGDVIEWDWEATGGTVDFWIEDIWGTEYRRLDNAVSAQGQYTVPDSGIWEVYVENDGSTTVTLDYSFSIDRTAPTDWLWVLVLPVIIAIIVIVVIVVLVVVLVAGKKPKQPMYPPQQPGYPPQQPQGQYPPQQPPQYPPQQPPQQPPPQP